MLIGGFRVQCSCLQTPVDVLATPNGRVLLEALLQAGMTERDRVEILSPKPKP